MSNTLLLLAMFGASFVVSYVVTLLLLLWRSR